MPGDGRTGWNLTMQINLTELGEEYKHYKGEDDAEVFDLEEDNSLRPDGPLSYDVAAELVSDQLIVRGRIWAPMHFLCCRCAVWNDCVVEVNDFLVAIEVGEEDELADLTPEMREAIILALPDYPLCGESCKGLCSQCGADWNKKVCDCQSPVDNRWEGLGGLEL